MDITTAQNTGPSNGNGNGAGAASPAPEEKKTVIFKGGDNREYEIDENLYRDLTARFQGEKNSIKARYDKELEDIKVKFQETENELKNIRLAAMSDKEKIEHEKSERENMLNEARAQADQNYQRYSSFRKKSEINAVINKHLDKLAFPPQYMEIVVENMLRPELDKDERVVCGGMDLDAAFERFILDPANKSLLKNNLAPGTGTSLAPSAPGGIMTIKRSEYLLNQKKRIEINNRIKNGEKINITED